MRIFMAWKSLDSISKAIRSQEGPYSKERADLICILGRSLLLQLGLNWGKVQTEKSVGATAVWAITKSEAVGAQGMVWILICEWYAVSCLITACPVIVPSIPPLLSLSGAPSKQTGYTEVLESVLKLGRSVWEHRSNVCIQMYPHCSHFIPLHHMFMRTCMHQSKIQYNKDWNAMTRTKASCCFVPISSNSPNMQKYISRCHFSPRLVFLA